MKIIENYESAQKTQSAYLAELAKDQLDRDNAVEAVRIALSALPTDQIDCPILPTAEYVLTQALNLYTLPQKAQVTSPRRALL